MRERTAPRPNVGLLVLVVLALASAAALGLALFHDLTSPYLGYREPEVFVDLPPGTSTARIAAILEKEGVVPSALCFRSYVRAAGLSRDLKAGEYRFSQPLSPVEVARRIAEGRVYLHRITVAEGLDLAQVRDLLVARGFWSAGDIEHALEATDLVRDLAPQAPDLEGYLFPETYAFPRSASALDLVRAMTGRFRVEFGPDLREEAARQGLSVGEAVTLASLVEEEVRIPAEAPLVSSVLHNRLDRGMPLEVDATVIYALKREGTYHPPLTRDDLQTDSPWNTYRHPGLPPGPIANPGREALLAAVRPAATGFLYYVLEPDGSGRHRFSRTYAEHLQAVRRLKRAGGASGQYR